MTRSWLTTSVILIGVASSLALTALTGCSGKKAKTTPELSRLVGKKVALIGVEGEATSRSVVEVALINQLVRTGTFEIVSKQEVDAARNAPDVDPTDWKTVSRRAGADYALQAKVLAFSAETKKGYSEEAIEDSQLEEETGNGKTTRMIKVERMDGHVSVELQFTDVSEKGSGETRSGIAERSDSVTAEGKTGAVHLPPKLRFLEKIANEAFHQFFEKYR